MLLSISKQLKEPGSKISFSLIGNSKNNQVNSQQSLPGSSLNTSLGSSSTRDTWYANKKPSIEETEMLVHFSESFLNLGIKMLI